MQKGRGLAVIAFVATLFLSVPGGASAVIDETIVRAPSSDTNYNGVAVKAMVTQPQYWQLYDVAYQSVSNEPVGELLMINQADLGSYNLSREIEIIQSTSAGIFRLPPAVATQLAPSDLVNFYLYQAFKTAIAPSVTNTGVTTIHGKKAYFANWTQVLNGIQYQEIDYFIFDATSTYQLHGSYSAYATDQQHLIDQTLRSIQVRN